MSMKNPLTPAGIEPATSVPYKCRGNLDFTMSNTVHATLKILCCKSLPKHSVSASLSLHIVV